MSFNYPLSKIKTTDKSKDILSEIQKAFKNLKIMANNHKKISITKSIKRQGIRLSFCLVVSMLLLSSGYAQTESEVTRGNRQIIDSLSAAIDTTSDRTQLYHIYSWLTRLLFVSNQDSSLVYAEKTLAVAKELDIHEYIADAYSSIGYSNYILNNYGQSFISYNQAKQIMESPAYLLSSTFEGETEKERQKIQQSELAHLTRDMGHLYGATGNKEKRLASYLYAKEVFEQIKDTIGLAYAHMNLGGYYTYNDQLEQGVYYYKEAEAYFSSSTDQLWLPGIYNGLGYAYFSMKEYESAEAYYHKAIKVAKKENNLPSLGVGFLGLAQLNLALHNIKESHAYAGQALAIAKKINAPYGFMVSYKTFAEVYHAENKIDSAYYYMEQHLSLKDSLHEQHLERLKNYQNTLTTENERLQNLEAEKIAFRNKWQRILLLLGIGIIAFIAWIFYRNSKKEKTANTKLVQSYADLQAAQNQLIQSEKMASLGELTAGIAHEIQNPLNFVNNFAEVSKELLEEMQEELDNGDAKEAKGIAKDVISNLGKIHHHGQRADSIVKGMLQHSRTSSGKIEPTDINNLADEYLRLAYHGIRAKDKSFNAKMHTDFDETVGKIKVIPQDMGRVILNLITNAFYAVNDKAKKGIEGYKPKVSISTKRVDSPLGVGGENRQIEISITDNGKGIPKNIIEKIFQPFFTTKPTGEGTGLGLSLSYDIVQAHGGELLVESEEGIGTTFRIVLPKNN